VPETCFYCDAVPDPTVPSIIAHCTQCWAEEHPNVKARQQADYICGLTVEEGIAAQAQRLSQNAG
jgi:hypothetical protein